MRRLGSTSTNPGLRPCAGYSSCFHFRLRFISIGPTTLRTQRKFRVGYKDLRNRRLSESTLRGWLLDRSGKLENALALYRRDSGGNIYRDYPMDKPMAHLFGTDLGDPGLERALFGVQSGALPEALEVVRGKTVEFTGNKDVRLTIDRDLQQAAVDQLKGKHGAVVVLNRKPAKCGLYITFLISKNNDEELD